jgi:hypothetical protein
MVGHNLSDEFLLALQSLFDWFESENVPGTSIGGVAVSLLAQPRVTQDIDAVIWLEEEYWESFLEAGKKHGIVPRISDALDFVRRARVLLLKHESSGISIDVSMGSLEFELEMIERAVTLRLGALSIKIPTPEDLMITKAVAQRPKDLADMDSIASATPHLDVQRVRHWVKQFAEALEMPEIAESAERVLSHYSAPG